MLLVGVHHESPSSSSSSSYYTPCSFFFFWVPRWREGLHFLDLFLKQSKVARDPGTLAPMPPAPDATTYCAAITGCSRGKQWREALRLLEDMAMEVGLLYLILCLSLSQRVIYHSVYRRGGSTWYLMLYYYCYCCGAMPRQNMSSSSGSCTLMH